MLCCSVMVLLEVKIALHCMASAVERQGACDRALLLRRRGPGPEGSLSPALSEIVNRGGESSLTAGAEAVCPSQLLWEVMNLPWGTEDGVGKDG